MFPCPDSGPSAQQLSLANALVAYCAHCDQLENLGPFVTRVAHKHVSFSVQPEQVDRLISSYIYTIYTIYLHYLHYLQYPVVGGVLLATLEEVLGKETFNEAVKGAVAEAYFFLADIFIR